MNAWQTASSSASLHRKTDDLDTKMVGVRRVFHGYENKRDPRGVVPCEKRL